MKPMARTLGVALAILAAVTMAALPGAQGPPSVAETLGHSGEQRAMHAAAPAEDRPVASWPMDESVGTVLHDTSGHGITCTLQSLDPDWSWIDGKHGAGLRFDGFDDSADCGTDPRLDLQGDFSIVLWVRFSTFSSGESLVSNGTYTVYHAGSSDGHKLHFLYRTSAGSIGGDSRWPDWAGVRSGTGLAAGQWYHVAAVVSGTSMSLYVNGQLERKLDLFDRLVRDHSKTSELLLGSSRFDGALDEVALHDRALPADEIAALAARGYWLFDETSGATAHDTSPHGYDCALANIDSTDAWVAGVDGRALAFDGVDDLGRCDDDNIVNMAETFSVDTWVRFDEFAERQTPITDGSFRLVRHGDPPDSRLFFLHAIDESVVGGDSTWDGWSGVRSAVPVTDGEWHHVIGVRDGPAMRLYVDGHPSESRRALLGLTPSTSSAGPLVLGQPPFRGALDSLWISDHAVGDEWAERRHGAVAAGAHVNPTGAPIAGGAGYLHLVDPVDAKYPVSDLPNFLHALAQASAGDVVYVDDDAEIDLSDQSTLTIRPGAVLASGRGRLHPDGSVSQGALLYSDRPGKSPQFHVPGEGSRVTGLRIRGPNPEVGDRDAAALALSTGISSSAPQLEIDNCEISGWGYAAIAVGSGAENVLVHHNHIHHNRRYAYGFGVLMSQASGTVEANLFDFNRYHVYGSGRPGTQFEVRHNVVGEHGAAYDVSMYGARDFEWSISKGNWRLDEGRGRKAADSSSYARNECVVHGATWVVGKVKNALSFDGVDDYVACGTDESLDMGNTFSLEAWVRPRRLPDRARPAAVVGKNGGVTDWAEVPFQIAQYRSGELAFSVGDGTSSDRLDISIPDTQKWHHVVGVFDRGRMHAYLDGELVGSKSTMVSPLTAPTQELIIGRWQSSFDGTVDEVRLHSAALSAEQVRVHMLSPDLAGDRADVHHNTFLSRLLTNFVLRGRPADRATVHGNWFRAGLRETAVRQYYADENLDVYHNRYGDEPPAGVELPRALAIVHPRSGRTPLQANFYHGDSSVWGGARTARWDFGDGATASASRSGESSVDHTYTEPGRYQAQLTVTDDAGVPDTDTVTLHALPPPGTRFLSLWVQDSYRGDISGRYTKQVIVDSAVVWEDDVDGDEGWQHVTTDVTELLRGRESVTLTLRVTCLADHDPTHDLRELLVYWDDVNLFYGAVDNGGFESMGAWTYAEAPQSTRWSGWLQSVDVRSGGRSYVVNHPYGVPATAGSYAELHQVVRIPRVYLPYTMTKP